MGSAGRQLDRYIRRTESAKAHAEAKAKEAEADDEAVYVVYATAPNGDGTRMSCAFTDVLVARKVYLRMARAGWYPTFRAI